MAGNNLVASKWQGAGAGKTSDLGWLQTKAAQSPRVTRTLLEALTSPEQRHWLKPAQMWHKEKFNN